MKTLLTILLSVVIAIQAYSAPQSPASAQTYKKLTLAEFFAGEIEAIPLSIEIPSQYVHAEGLDVEATYSYWMRTEDVAAAVKTQDLPKKNGYIYGKVSLDMAYDADKGKFANEAKFEAEMKKAGFKFLELKRQKINGHPILSFMAKDKKGHLVNAMYVATLVDTNVIYIAYQSPENDLKTAQSVWKHILASLK